MGVGAPTLLDTPVEALVLLRAMIPSPRPPPLLLPLCSQCRRHSSFERPGSKPAIASHRPPYIARALSSASSSSSDHGSPSRVAPCATPAAAAATAGACLVLEAGADLPSPPACKRFAVLSRRSAWPIFMPSCCNCIAVDPRTPCTSIPCCDSTPSYWFRPASVNTASNVSIGAFRVLCSGAVAVASRRLLIIGAGAATAGALPRLLARRSPFDTAWCGCCSTADAEGTLGGAAGGSGCGTARRAVTTGST